VDLEVREREGEALGANIRAMREARVRLFCFRPEAQPTKHRFQLVAQMPVAARPRAGIASARVRVIAFRIVPAAPTRAPSRAAASARSALRLERDSQSKAYQGGVLPVEEGKAVFRGGDR